MIEKMNKRDRVYQKYNGLCAYSGTKLEPDWQMEHINPVQRNLITGKPDSPQHDNENNLVPVQKIINHYKGSLDLETFRTWYLGEMHTRLLKVPNNPKTDKAKRKKEYILKVCSYFNITESNPFSGKFYFETLNTTNAN